MNTQTVIQIEESELDRFLERMSEELLQARYSAREVTAPTVAEIWGVTVQAVNAHVRTGKLHPVNPGSSKYRFRLSDVLITK